MKNIDLKNMPHAEKRETLLACSRRNFIIGSAATTLFGNYSEVHANHHFMSLRSGTDNFPTTLSLADCVAIESQRTVINNEISRIQGLSEPIKVISL